MEEDGASVPDKAEIDEDERTDGVFVKRGQIVDCGQASRAVAPSEGHRGQKLENRDKTCSSLPKSTFLYKFCLLRWLLQASERTACQRRWQMW